MKKLLSFIMIAAIATSGIFAITTTDVVTNSPNNVSLTEAKISVILGSSPVNIDIAYDGGDGLFSQLLSDQTVISNALWQIQETTPAPYLTNYFGVIFSDGSIEKVGTETNRTFKVQVSPGPFKTNNNNVAHSDALETVEIVPQATAGVGLSSTPLTGNAKGIEITTAALDVGTFIQEAVVASFTLDWTSADEVIVQNTEGLYTSTTTISINTI
jgi:hypothetical protein